MKGYIYRFFALLTTVLGVWALAGCADDGETFMTEESGCFNLVVTVPDESATRATEAELGFNEFKVTTLHFYFYNDAASASVYDYVWTGEFNTTQKVTVPLPGNALLDGGLFGATGTECTVYAVANVDETILPKNTAKTIAELKATGISSGFDKTEIQPSFAMDGQAAVTLDRSARRATGAITLERAAAKIALSVEVPATITVPGTTAGTEITYTPNTVSMHVWIGNGVKNSKLNTAAEPAATADLYSNEIKAGVGIGTAFTKNDAAEKYKYIQNVPFYSYPNKWESTSPDGNCYLTLVLPWTYKNGDATQQITTYYRVPVQRKECKIERNMHYDIRVTIGRIGSSEPQKPVDMEVEWNYAIPWNTHTLQTDIKEVRYLLLNNNYYDTNIGAYAFDMNNTTEIEIPVGTSHNVEIESVTLSWTDYSNNPPVKREIPLTADGGTYQYNSKKDSYNSVDDFAGIEMDNSTSKLFLKRNMLHIKSGRVWVEEHRERQWVNGRYQWVTIPAHWEDKPIERTQEPAFNSYTFDIKLRHADDDKQTAMVHITQYPPIYITADLTAEATHRIINTKTTNDFGSELDGNGKPNRRQYSGYLCYIPYSETDNYYLGDIYSGGANRNTYVINITRFDESNTYVIADPRSRSVNNLQDNGSPTQSAAWAKSDAQGNQLDNYYPTAGNADKKYYIAPKIRIASQLGATQPVTVLGAQRRCAAYQENGRPAGRWRLPTVAEIEYIATLSSKSYIPYLFGDKNEDVNYWCASGAVTVHNPDPNDLDDKASVDEATDGSNRRAVRCVYDEWYWGADTLTDKTQFLWGDRPRTTSGN